jgi:hypothetical protein
MISTLLFSIGEWVSWPLIALLVMVVAILRKDHVRAAIKLKPFQFSLEAKDLRSQKKK